MFKKGKNNDLGIESSVDIINNGKSILVPKGIGMKNYHGRMNEHKEAKLLIIGVDNAGKTAIFNTIVKKEETDYKDLLPTQGFNTQKI